MVKHIIYNKIYIAKIFHQSCLVDITIRKYLSDRQTLFDFYDDYIIN